ncbi:KdsC family phosphatase [Sediminibacterium soli]|uniref:KdsC family phosphatase n=1 Tax=Sediminibacterium soli TaxID=2698829 RepID=UPI00137B239D|nr:3-deoxy-D-manno-octulosonate 8-phosphate phosphatase [Sediminibacterium soli]NCI47078.1 3-deoxy-D-manno-octulosonate 8-phosphate phosphatase [Sediminibacterium soli]
MLDRFKHITTFVFDVDGVLTDGTLLVLPGGVMARSMNIRDGYALQLAVKKGYRVLVISGGHSPEVKDRLEKLGVREVWMQTSDKAGILSRYLQQHAIGKEQVLYMGDDIPDHGVMQLAGLPCCPQDAVQEIKQLSIYISHLAGGKGCARDVIEKVMKLRGDWSEDTSVKAQ